MSHTYLIQPRDTVLFRDGRPFGLTGTEGARSLPFPVPSTTAGLLRTLSGQDEQGCFQPEKVEEVKTLHVTGPVLVRLLSNDQEPHPKLEWLLPAPADALVVKRLETSDTSPCARILPLRPLALPPDAVMDLSTQEVRTLAGATERIQGKPQSGPAYWHWPALRLWLEHEGDALPHACARASEPQAGPLKLALEGTLPWSQLDTLGHSGPEEETRTHVGINPDSATASTGALFQTRGRSFFQKKPAGSPHAEASCSTRAPAQAPAPATHVQLGLVVRLSAPSGTLTALKPGSVSLGGERRISFLNPLADSALQGSPFMACPASLRQRIVAERACRLLLATPAWFREGAFPTWLLSPGPRFSTLGNLILEAACMERPQTISGWDMERNRPKHTVRLVRAGAVFFLRFPEKWQDTDISGWIDAVWLQNVSDTLTEQDDHATAKRKDGFGLALLGAWSGKRTSFPIIQEDAPCHA